MTLEPNPHELRFGEWCAERTAGELKGPTGIERLEPKVMELLFLLGQAPQRVFTREEIMAQLWPGVVVGEDTLSRAVFKLRKALEDDVKAPRFIETIPKRGYRFIFQEGAAGHAPPAPEPTRSSLARSSLRLRSVARSSVARRAFQIGGALALVGALGLGVGLGVARWRRSRQTTEAQVLIDRANDFYFQYSRVDNEAAIELFERVVAQHPEHAPAYAGLANAYAQRVVRWPVGPPSQGREFKHLQEALAQGHTRTPSAIRELIRANTLAERAVALAPKDASAHKALGFVRSVREDFPGAMAAYAQAVALDPDAWGPLINMGDVLEITGQREQALPYFERAFQAMTRVYPQQTARIRPWYAELALMLGDRHLALGHRPEAERWFRKTLEIAPFHPKGTQQLAALLRSTQRGPEADQLLARLQQALGGPSH